MPSSLRDQFGLTQERLASWLGVNRTTVAMAESGRRNQPTSRWLLDARIELAALELVFNPGGETMPAPPPVPTPPVQRLPLDHRLVETRYQILRLQRELKSMRKRAAQFEARLRAVPALRAWTGPVRNPAREAGWLALFEEEAVDGLRDDCGAGQQLLLEARIAGLEHETGLLAAAVANLPAQP
ncbi:helix-turn-helix domain-containing protein [Hymenobacter terrenus]|uniref:helix-turn-helix domain-containing protein n=1 Tax=Hymenobacter terrenus TaxID=1629124 RepID=UPI000619BDDD|nr:helix-turn-helix domain-containing protein [Hymenobacter terrenus]